MTSSALDVQQTAQTPSEPVELERSEARTITLRLPTLRRSDQSRTGRRFPRRILAALFVVLLLGNGWLWWQTNESNRVEKARASAVTAAQFAVPKVLSYSYKTLDADLAGAREETTGSFKTDFATLLDTVVIPAARQKQVTTKAEVRGSAVVQSSAGHVMVLVFITQTTTAGDAGTPLVTGSRVNVTMTKTHGKWLVSALNPV